MKDFVEQINDIIAPVTRAWDDPEIQSIGVDHGGRSDTEKLSAMLNNDEITVTVVVKLKRRKDGMSVGQLAGGRAAIKAFKQTMTNAIAGEGPKRGVK